METMGLNYMKVRQKKKRAKQAAPSAPRVNIKPPRSASATRARFLREFRGSYVSYDLYRKTQEANKRIKQLERAGLNPPQLQLFKNALGADTVELTRKTPFGRIQQLEMIVSKFVGSKWTTVSGAQEVEQNRRKNFEKLTRELIGQISQQTMDTLYNYVGDMDIRQLIDEYVYEEVMLAAHEISDIGGNVTKSNVKMAIDRGLDYYIEYELSERGYNLDMIDNPYFDKDTIIDVARAQGINSAIAFWEQNT